MQISYSLVWQDVAAAVQFTTLLTQTTPARKFEDELYYISVFIRGGRLLFDSCFACFCACRYEEMTQDTLFSWGLPESMAQWQWDMYQYTIHLGYYAPERDLSLSRRLDPNFMTWQGFLQQSRFDGNQTLTDVRSSQRKT